MHVFDFVVFFFSPPSLHRFAAFVTAFSLGLNPLALCAMEASKDSDQEAQSPRPAARAAPKKRAKQKQKCRTEKEAFDFIAKAARPMRSPFEIALTNIEDNASLLVAWRALKKCPPSLVRLGYQHLLTELDSDFSAEDEPRLRDITSRKQFPPEVRSMLKASELLRHYNQSEKQSEFRQRFRRLLKKKQESNEKTIIKLGECEESYSCPRFFAAMAHARKRSTDTTGRVLCYQLLRAFGRGALDAGPLVPKDFVRSAFCTIAGMSTFAEQHHH